MVAANVENRGENKCCRAGIFFRARGGPGGGGSSPPTHGVPPYPQRGEGVRDPLFWGVNFEGSNYFRHFPPKKARKDRTRPDPNDQTPPPAGDPKGPWGWVPWGREKSSEPTPSTPPGGPKLKKKKNLLHLRTGPVECNKPKGRAGAIEGDVHLVASGHGRGEKTNAVRPILPVGDGGWHDVHLLGPR